MTSAKLTVAGGIAMASFHPVFNRPDNLFETSVWLEGSNLPLRDLKVPNFSLANLGFNKMFQFPELKVPNAVPILGGKVIFPGATIPPMPSPLPDTNALLGDLGIPTSLKGYIDSDWIGFAQDFPDEEPILDAGFAVGELTMFLEGDVLEENLLFRIERNLAGHEDDGVIAQFLLPKEFGGFLEVARGIVAETILAMQQAGQDTGEAVEEPAEGDEELATGEFKEAYEHYRHAYQEATS